MLIPLIIHILKDISARQAFKESVVIDTVDAVTLFSSISTFRLFVSPLRRIPGPFILRLTELTHVWDMAVYQNCKILQNYQKKYGDFMHTGSSNSVYYSVTIFQSFDFIFYIFQGSLFSCYNLHLGEISI